MLNKIKNNKKGFTIVEVLIVLAIAAIIIVTVLIAVPQLQRNQRNNAYKNDATKVAAALQEWNSSNSGTQLVACTNQVSNNQMTFTTGTGTVANVTSNTTNCTVYVQAAVAGGTLIPSGGVAPAKGNVIVVSAAQCGTLPAINANIVAGSVSSGNSQQYAIFYTIENPNASWACLNS